MNCLVIRAGALGDTLLTLPAVRALRLRYPEIRMTVVGYRELWSIGGHLIDSIESIDGVKFASLFSSRPSPDLLAWLAPFELAVAWTTRDPGAALRAAGIPSIVHASPHPPPGIHTTDWLLGTLALPHPPPPIDLPSGRRPGNGAIYLHPGAGAQWKRWPATHFASLADRLVESGHRVILVEGPADEQAIPQTQAAASHTLPVLRESVLPALVDTLRRGRLFVGNDSGITHLAALAGVPTVALFGPTDPASWAPRGNVTVLRQCAARSTRQGKIRVCEDATCMASLRVAPVIEEVERLLSHHVDNSVDNSPHIVEKGPDNQ